MGVAAARMFYFECKNLITAKKGLSILSNLFMMIIYSASIIIIYTDGLQTVNFANTEHARSIKLLQ